MATSFNSAETLEFGLTAFGTSQALPAELPALRRKPHEHVKAPGGVLKYADDQAVVATAAVLRAIHEFGLHDTKFTDWGVISAPRFLGRETCAIFLDRLARQGALGISPLLAAYQSMHAVAGTISLALKIHGPNMGVAGGHGGVEQLLITGLAMQCEHRLPGIWMVLSEWHPEPIADDNCKVPADGICRALAMAFMPVAASWQGLRLRLRPGPASGFAKEEIAEPALTDLADFLKNSIGHSAGGLDVQRSWQCPLRWQALVELTTECHSQTADRSILAA